MAQFKDIDIEEVDKSIQSDVSRISPTDGINGGFALTGFIDVEKLIRIKSCPWDEKNLFIEKKLPFSIVVLSLEASHDKEKEDTYSNP